MADDGVGRVHIIVPTWNNISYLVQCVETILRYTRDVSYRVTVVDNGSQDDTVAYLRDRSEEGFVEVIRHEENRGWIGGCNAGFDSLGAGEHVLVANDDIRVTDPLWLARLVDVLESNSRNGVVGPTSNYAMGYQSVSLPPGMPLVHRVRYVVGFCMLIRRECFDEVGRFDTRFGLGGEEDFDYCIRVSDAGWRILVDRRVFVWHYGNRTGWRLGGPEKISDANKPLLIQKHGRDKVGNLFEPLTDEELNDI